MTVGTGDIAAAARVLRRGGLVAVPTETVYGLGADAENPAAVARIFAAKGRPTSHPLIVHIGDAAELAGWVAEVPDAARTLADRFWPGPMTLVLRRGRRVPAATTGGQDTVAVRVPNHPVALALLAEFGGGIAAPSANRFGSVSPTTANDVRAELGDAVDLVLDGGPCTVGVESTIVDLTGDAPRILRPGGVTREELEQALARPMTEPAAAGGIRVPGQHPSHYAPHARVVLVPADRIEAEAHAAAARGRRVGVLLPAGHDRAAVSAHAVLEAPGDLDEFARGLYGYFREFDRRGCDVILASLPPQDGIGRAIANRLGRAAGPRRSDAGE